MSKAKVFSVVFAVLAALGVVAYTQLTIFVVQPIGAVPEGKVLVASKVGNSPFIDSADAMCERANGGVSLLCRGIMMGRFAENTTVYARLPYSEWLYEISTGGRSYSR